MRCSSPGDGARVHGATRVAWLVWLCALGAGGVAGAQPAPLPPATTAPAQPGPSTWTLEAALRHAGEHYPSVRAAVESVTASAAAVDVARAAVLPRLDAVWQTNRATVNNVTGLLFPHPAVPPISGPPLADTSARSVWGTATGALFTWEPWDFGVRRAHVAGAEAAVTRARADEGLTRLEVQGAVWGAFMAAAVAQRAVEAARADVARRDVLTRVARSLVEAQLRPGADASRAEAERAAAATRLAQARQALALALATLQRVLASETPVVAVSADALLAPPPPSVAPLASAQAPHPLARLRQSAVDEARVREDELAKTFVPRLFVLSSVFARGSGADPNGALHGGTDGLGLERPNWAAGVQVVLPNPFELPALRARRAAAAAVTRAESARLDEARLIVTSQRQAAAAVLDAARDVAAQTPVQLAAATQVETQARARYQAGLASVVEVAEAQNLLAQAEAQDEVARIEVWRALLAESLAQGSLDPFITHVSSTGAR